MLMFPSRRTHKPEPQPTFTKDWRDAGPEIERLGQRLDAARGAAASAKEDSWAKNFWSTQSEVLFRKWTHAVRLHEVGMRQQGKVNPGVSIQYDWWEPSDEVSMRFPLLDGITAWFTDKVSSPNLDRAWEMAINEKVQKARLGLA